MTNARENSRFGHAFRPGPFRRRRAYWLDGAVLHWRVGDRAGRTPLADIASMRLDAPAGGTSAARCAIVEKSGRVHKLSDVCWPRWVAGERRLWGRPQRREATFRSLTLALARRLTKANPDAIVEVGPSRREWIASCVVAIAVVATIVAGGGFMVAQGRFSHAALAFMAMAAVQLPMLWPVVRSGGPRRVDGDDLA